MGHRTVRNETTGEDVEIAVADYCHSLAHARKLLANGRNQISALSSGAAVML